MKNLSKLLLLCCVVVFLMSACSKEALDTNASPTESATTETIVAVDPKYILDNELVIYEDINRELRGKMQDIYSLTQNYVVADGQLWKKPHKFYDGFDSDAWYEVKGAHGNKIITGDYFCVVTADSTSKLTAHYSENKGAATHIPLNISKDELSFCFSSTDQNIFCFFMRNGKAYSQQYSVSSKKGEDAKQLMYKDSEGNVHDIEEIFLKPGRKGFLARSNGNVVYLKTPTAPTLKADEVILKEENRAALENVKGVVCGEMLYDIILRANSEDSIYVVLEEKQSSAQPIANKEYQITLPNGHKISDIKATWSGTANCLISFTDNTYYELSVDTRYSYLSKDNTEELFHTCEALNNAAKEGHVLNVGNFNGVIVALLDDHHLYRVQ